MPLKGFLRILLYANLAGAVIFGILCLLWPLYKYIYMAIFGLAFFSLMALIIYLLGENALKNPRSGAFLSIIVINTFMKLLACFAFVFIYVKIRQPEDRLFLIPFFLFYLVFVIMETYFLSIQARKSKIP